MFIAFDGIDGAGKSTQILRLVQHLESTGHDVRSVRDPGSTAAGEAVRDLLLFGELELHRRAEAMLYMAARCQLVEQCIRPALAAGHSIVSDRFLLANVAYQSAAGGMDIDELWRLGEISTSGVRPDLTILLDLPAEVAIERRRRPPDRIELRGLEYLEAVRETFLKQLPRAGRSHVVIDATQSLDAVYDQIREAVETELSKSAFN